jgi:hypothetical protein
VVVLGRQLSRFRAGFRQNPGRFGSVLPSGRRTTTGQDGSARAAGDDRPRPDRR